MSAPDDYDVYADPMWAELGNYPAEVRDATRWERLVLWLRKVRAHVRL